MSNNTPAIIHLLYADDLMLAGKANQRCAKAIWECFGKFCSWLGQKINKDKSNVLFSDNLSREGKR